jgi:transcriptional regulator
MSSSRTPISPAPWRNIGQRSSRPTGELRRAFGMTQVELAEKLGTVQANISKTEKRNDLLLSTLANYLSAMGADDVKIVVRRGDREIEVTFEALAP